MLDIRFVRENPDIIKKNLEKKGEKGRQKEVDEVLKNDLLFRSMLQKTQELRHRRNVLSAEINKAKKDGKPVKNFLKEAKDIPKKLMQLEEGQNKIREEIRLSLMNLPNILHESVPFGETEEDNKVVRKWGKKKKYDFELKSHVDMLEALDVADLERAAKISGSRFYFLKNELVMLDFALMKLALDILHKKNYTLISPPLMMKRKPYEGVTDMHDFEDVMYKIDDEDLYLIATSEHPMAAMHMNEIMEKLPVKYAGISACFRKEAGSHGKDTKGIFRVHQFNKIEQFVFCKPEESWQIHEELLKNAEEIFQKLELPYRIVNICTADIGTIAAKKYDLEVWMPSQKCYRELVSCSNCTAYQATRLGIKYTGKESKEYVHTLNSTAIATSRAMVAILENFQNKDGSVDIPKALHPYMNGIKKIKNHSH